MVHIVESFIFAAHRPYKGVVGGAAAGMYAPRGAYNRLLVLHNYVACFGRLAHHMEDYFVFGNFKIEVYFHSALVGVGRHSVPNAAFCKLRHTHRKLAGFKHVGVNELVDNAFVRRFCVAAGNFVRVFNG